MSLNLILDPWIPVVMTDGQRRVIRPDEIANDSLLSVDWHREDLNIACLEYLIGLCFAALAPADLEEWEDGLEIGPAELRAAFKPLAPAFNLTGAGPLFCQDFSEFTDGIALEPDALFPDSAGEKTIRENKDVMVRRNRYGDLSLPEAAMAIYAFQSYASANGAGKRVGLRGGGPMVTLVVPGDSFWEMIWANVPYGKPAALTDFPWMRPTVCSKRQPPLGGSMPISETVTLALGQEMTVETFFALPRRIRLICHDSKITGFREQTFGTNYVGCLHPLTPNFTDKTTKDLVPLKVNVSRLGYDNWIGTIIPAEQGTGRERAQTLRTFQERFPGQRASALVAGWNMNKASAVNFMISHPVLHSLSERDLVLLRAMIKTAETITGHLYRAIKDAMDIPSGIRIEAEFYSQTEASLERLYAELGRGAPRHRVGSDWFDEMRKTALSVFDGVTLPGMTRRDPEVMSKIVKGRQSLKDRFNINHRASAGLRALLEMEEVKTA